MQRSDSDGSSTGSEGGGIESVYVPDLFVQFRGAEKYVRLDFRKNLPGPKELDCLDRLFAWGIQSIRPEIKPQQVLSIRVHTGQIVPAGKPGPQFKKQIQDTWNTIESMWPNVPNPRAKDDDQPQAGVA